MATNTARKRPGQKLFNVRLQTRDYRLIQAAAAANSETMAEFLRRVLKAEAKKMLNAELNKENGK